MTVEQVRSQLPAPDTQQQQVRLEQSQRLDVRTGQQGGQLGAQQHVLVAARQQQSFTAVVSPMDPAPQHQSQHPAYHHHPAAAYPHYPVTPGYRMTGSGPFMSPSSGGYSGGMSGARITQHHQQQGSVSVGGPPSYGDTSTPVVVAGGPASTRVNPGSGRASSTPSTQVPTKVEAGTGGYDLPADAYNSGGVKGSNYAAVVSQGHKLSHRPSPNVTVVPVVPPGAPAMSLQPHPGGTGVGGGGMKWMPLGAGGVARHAYPPPAGGYGMDGSSTGASVRQPTPTDSTGGGGWSLSMSQTQSLYMSNVAAADAPPYQTGYPSSQDSARSLQRMPPQRIIPGPCSGDVPPHGVFQQQRSVSVNPAGVPPGHVFMHDAAPAYPHSAQADPGSYGSHPHRDFMFTDNGVFPVVSK